MDVYKLRTHDLTAFPIGYSHHGYLSCPYKNPDTPLWPECRNKCVSEEISGQRKEVHNREFPSLMGGECWRGADPCHSVEELSGEAAVVTSRA